jgi:hypothetical protein
VTSFLAEGDLLTILLLAMIQTIHLMEALARIFLLGGWETTLILLIPVVT